MHEYFLESTSLYESWYDKGVSFGFRESISRVYIYLNGNFKFNNGPRTCRTIGQRSVHLGTLRNTLKIQRYAWPIVWENNPSVIHWTKISFTRTYKLPKLKIYPPQNEWQKKLFARFVPFLSLLNLVIFSPKSIVGNRLVGNTIQPMDIWNHRFKLKSLEMKQNKKQIVLHFPRFRKKIEKPA